MRNTLCVQLCDSRVTCVLFDYLYHSRRVCNCNLLGLTLFGGQQLCVKTGSEHGMCVWWLESGSIVTNLATARYRCSGLYQYVPV